MEKWKWKKKICFSRRRKKKKKPRCINGAYGISLRGKNRIPQWNRCYSLRETTADLKWNKQILQLRQMISSDFGSFFLFFFFSFTFCSAGFVSSVLVVFFFFSSPSWSFIQDAWISLHKWYNIECIRHYCWVNERLRTYKLLFSCV